MNKNEIKNLIEELTKDPDLYIDIKTLTERFVEIDKEHNHGAWDLLQILSQLRTITPRRVGNNIVKEMLENENRGEAYRILQDLKGGN